MAPVITSPVPGATVSGTVNLIGTYGGVTGEVMNGTTVIGTVVLVQPVPFSVPVDTTQLANGVQPLSFSDGVNVATVSVIVNNVVAPPVTTLTISSPAAGAAEGETFSVTGIAGSQWVNVSVFDDATGTKVGTDVTPGVGGAFTIPVNMGALSGTRQIDVIGFTVPAGQSGGTQATASVSVTITPAPTLAVSAPTNGFSQASPVTVSGTTNQSSVVISNAAGAVLATVTPANGAFSTSLTLAAGSYALSVSAGTATPVAVSGTVTAAPPAAKLPYWAVNCHYNQGGWYSQTPIATQVALMQLIGAEGCRQDMYDVGDAQTIAGLISQFAPIKVLPCYIPTYSGSTAQVYAAAYADGQTLAGLFAGKVPMVEIGNEWNLADISGNAQGNLPSNFNESETVYSMAVMAGFCEGFRSKDPTSQTLLGVNTTYVEFGWLQMIVNNTLPNGSASGYTINFDVATWHDYQTGGDMANTSTPSGNVNVLQSIKAITSKPIYFSECGAGNPNLSVAATQAYISSQLPEMLADSQVEGSCWYELVDFTDGDYGLADSNGNIKAQGTALKNFIAANPR
ncbi:hypothetical protein [Caballeronia sp. KNU42]